MKRKVFSILICSLLCASFLVGCKGKQEAVVKKANEPVTIKFYHSEDQYNKDMVAAYKLKNPNVTVQIVPVDFGNAEQVIKTGIAAGNPVDVSFYWGTAINAFVNANMAEDLTPYLEANNGEWKNTFDSNFIDSGKVNGKYYAVAYQPVFETIFYNKTIFQQNNLKAPETWSEFMKICETLKSKGVYGFAVSNDQQHQLLPFAYQIMNKDGNIKDITAGKVTLSGKNEAPGLRKNLELIQDAYKKGYWYPGEGALTSTKDEVKAAFYQGKVAAIFDASSQIKAHSEGAKFEVGVMKIPLVDGYTKRGINVVTNALFIPSNAAHKKEAIDFMKFYTSEEGQKITMSSWRPPVLKNVKIDNKDINELMESTKGADVFTYTQLQNLSPKITTFLQKELVSSVCSGQSIDSVLEKLENLRKEVAK